MKRNFSPQEWEATSLLVKAIGGIDRLVFLEDPIKIVIIKQRRGKEIWEKVSYIPREESADGTEHYNIFAYGIDKYLEAVIKKSQKVVVMVDDQGELMELENLPLLTLQVLVVGIAAHEVRHRLQEYNRIKMFSPADANNQALAPRVRGHIKIRRKFPPSRQKNPAEEFDAKVVELMAEEICYRKGDLQTNIANLLNNKG